MSDQTKSKSRFLLVFGTLLFLVTLFSLRPVPIVAEDKCVSIQGTIDNMFNGGNFDLVFTLKEYDQIFYINRGLENGLSLYSLKSQLMGERVTVKYPKYWTLFDPLNKVRHISKLEYLGHTIFSELET